MSAIRRRDRRGEWWVDFRYRRRRVRRRSPVQTKRGAEQLERQLRKEFGEDEAGGRNPFGGPPPTFADFAEQWFEQYVRPHNRPSTAKDKAAALRLHLLPRLGHLRLNEITPAHIDRVSAALIEAGRSPKTANNVLSMLRCCLTVAVEWHLLDHVPMVRRLRETEPGFRYLTVEEERRLLSATRPGFWRAFVLFLLQTGLRFNEAANVCWQHLKLDGQRPFMHVWKGGWNGTTGATKAGKLREVPLTDDVLTELGRLPHSSERIFPRRDGSVLHPASSAKALHRICRRADLEPFGWHTLRHTFATRHAEAGTPLPVLKELLGHSSIKMTMRYVHVAPTMLLGTADTIRRATPVPWRSGTQMVTESMDPAPAEGRSTGEFGSIQRETDPSRSALCWSG